MGSLPLVTMGRRAGALRGTPDFFRLRARAGRRSINDCRRQIHDKHGSNTGPLIDSHDRHFSVKHTLQASESKFTTGLNSTLCMIGGDSVSHLKRDIRYASIARAFGETDRRPAGSRPTIKA